MRKVPQLALMSYVEGSQNDRTRFIDQLFSGLKDYGFIVLTDHLVKQEAVNEAYQNIKEYFKLDEATKMKYYLEGLGGQRGHTPYKREHAKDHTAPDLKEFWHVGRIFQEQHLQTEQDRIDYEKLAKDVWPSEVANFKKVLSELYLSMDKTSEILLEAIGISLDVPKDFFKTMIHNGNSVLRVIHYPPIKGEDTKEMVRAAPHGDINLITLLVGATDSGLQLLDRDGQWLDVHSLPGQIVVDTGDMMERLTNGVLPSTIHRVINPDSEETERYSMPFFVHPRSEASLKCLPSCLGSGEKYPEITAGEFLHQRLKEIGLY